MSVVVRMMYETLWYGGSRRRSNSKEGGGLSLLVILLIGVVCCAVAYIFTLLTRFAISRKREYMADAGGQNFAEIHLLWHLLYARFRIIQALIT